MRYRALALDFDGTLATDGRVDDATVAALEAAHASGRRLALVTGRELPSLQRTFARVDLFDVVIAENGGLLFVPATGVQLALAPPPPTAFCEALRRRNVDFSVGAVIVAAWEKDDALVRAAIEEHALDVDVILNKGAVMVLPRGVNKGTGVARAATELAIPLGEIVGVGDAENDASLLRACGVGVAVANALDALKAQADIVTFGARGVGVVEIVARLVASDLEGFTRKT